LDGIGLYDNINFQKSLNSLKGASISDVNKKLVFDFVDYCFSEGLSKHRVIKYVSILKSIALTLQIEWDKVKKDQNFPEEMLTELKVLNLIEKLIIYGIKLEIRLK
jgi:hypothetical protein